MDNRLYCRRKELGLTLEEVGNICGVGKSTVRKWENGMINNMGRDKIILLAKALQVSPLFILQAESSERLLTEYDLQLLSITSKLTDIGKKKILDYSKDISTNPVYQLPDINDNSHLQVNAAHERTDIPLTKKGQNHDNDIMTNDDEWK